MSGVGPLQVDPEARAHLRPMMQVDVEAVAALHAADMGQSLWAGLGEPFLKALYGLLIDDPGFIGFVTERQGQIGGFIAGSTDADAMMARVFRRGAPLLGARALPALLRRPGLLRRLAETPRYARLSALPGPRVPAESLFCTVEPALRGQRVAGLLNEALFEELLARGHSFVKITTETSNTAARRQLGSWGFEERGAFAFYGKAMLICTLALRDHPRLQPRSRHPMLDAAAPR